ncbi:MULTISPECIES: metal-dependent hydrolase [Jonquetella]|uniref:Putative Zn-dependent hydrolase of beta-lactamase fold n=1 Tax=Jonquetella anthropi DSM 22815 TaxID=885272 RepID=H0UMK5_9BACT|nr:MULTISPECIES: metal-dependent hydrolase [Jonquetella]EHM13708.1 putative Zn-dependent hydrolase of beta-lactamase fold [Jonquetella anthropi DSM 22815]ERL23937.1 beta-lactamase family protein [Jonquetella sp. BV3C21]
MNAQFLGHSTVKIQSDYCSVLIDPFFTGNPMACNTVDDFIALDGMLLTHACHKRLADAVTIAKATECQVVCTEAAAEWMKEQGVAPSQLVVMAWGETRHFPFGTVTVVPAKSGTETAGPICGYVIEVEKHKVYHAGNTVLLPEMKDLSKMAIDLAFLPIGGETTMDVPAAVQACELIKAREVCPVHYNTFPSISADPAAFKKAVKGSEVIILQSSEKETL